MIHKIPTGSGLDRAANCPASFVLDWSPTPNGEEGKRGTAIHSFMEKAHEDREAALLLAPEDMRDHLRKLDLREMHPPYEREVPLALDVEHRKAWCLEKNGHRGSPPSRPGFVFMTLDAVDFGVRGVSAVADYKTGWAPKPTDSLQIKAAVAAVSLLGGHHAVMGTIIKLDDIAEPWRMAQMFDSFDLDDAFLSVKKVVERVEAEHTLVEHGAPPTVNPGPWCTFCPAMPSCPAKRRALEVAVTIQPRPVFEKTPTGLLEAWRALKSLEERVRVELELLARATPIPTKPGKVWGEVERKEHVILDHDRAYAVLCSEFGPEIADDFVHRNVTMKGIRGIVKQQAAVRGVKQAPLEREIIAALRGAGVLRIERSYEFREHNAEDGE